MTEHILNFAIEFDDERITKMVEKKAVDSILTDIEKNVMNNIFQSDYFGQQAVRVVDNYGEKSVKVDANAQLKDWVTNVIKEDLQKHRDKIIDLAAEKLADSYKRTKRWKDKTSEVIK